jgi:hypothetical protein
VTDEQFVREAEKGWKRAVDYSNEPGTTGTGAAVAVALWASLNVDRLIKIAKGHQS